MSPKKTRAELLWDDIAAAIGAARKDGMGDPVLRAVVDGFDLVMAGARGEVVPVPMVLAHGQQQAAGGQTWVARNRSPTLVIESFIATTSIVREEGDWNKGTAIVTVEQVFVGVERVSKLSLPVDLWAPTVQERPTFESGPGLDLTVMLKAEKGATVKLVALGRFETGGGS